MALLAPRKKDEDLFAETTMSFGEHLEELRVCLWKAVLGLVIGFAIGLMVGKQAVGAIQRPLEKALEKYYTDVTLERIAEDIEKNVLIGRAGSHYDVKDLRKKVDAGMIFETRYIDKQELLRVLGVEATVQTPPAVPPATTSLPAEGEVTSDVPLRPDVTPETPDVAEPDAFPNMVPLLIWQAKKDDHRTKASSLSASEVFMIWIKASFIVGALISAPWVFYQIWIFVASGLYGHERHYVYTFLPISLGLFFAGAALAYLFVFEPVLDFLFGFNKWLGINPDPRISEWISFVLFLPLGFGISFQLPLVMLFIERIGVVSVSDYLEKWRIAVLGIFVLSAVLTPADPYSLFLMAVPLTFLYFGGILLAMYLPKEKRQPA